jgi:hypothetical protein
MFLVGIYVSHTFVVLTPPFIKPYDLVRRNWLITQGECNGKLAFANHVIDERRVPILSYPNSSGCGPAKAIAACARITLSG